MTRWKRLGLLVGIVLGMILISLYLLYYRHSPFVSPEPSESLPPPLEPVPLPPITRPPPRPITLPPRPSPPSHTDIDMSDTSRFLAPVLPSYANMTLRQGCATLTPSNFSSSKTWPSTSCPIQHQILKLSRDGLEHHWFDAYVVPPGDKFLIVLSMWEWGKYPLSADSDLLGTFEVEVTLMLRRECSSSSESESSKFPFVGIWGHEERTKVTCEIDQRTKHHVFICRGLPTLILREGVDCFNYVLRFTSPISKGNRVTGIPSEEPHVISNCHVGLPKYRAIMTPKVNNVSWAIAAWVRHHRFLGFEHFFFYDHRSMDETSLRLSELGPEIVTHVRLIGPEWGRLPENGRLKYDRMPHDVTVEFWHGDITNRFRCFADLMSFVDVDEYLFFPHGLDSAIVAMQKENTGYQQAPQFVACCPEPLASNYAVTGEEHNRMVEEHRRDRTSQPFYSHLDHLTRLVAYKDDKAPKFLVLPLNLLTCGYHHCRALPGFRARKASQTDFFFVHFRCVSSWKMLVPFRCGCCPRNKEFFKEGVDQSQRSLRNVLDYALATRDASKRNCRDYRCNSARQNTSELLLKSKR